MQPTPVMLFEGLNTLSKSSCNQNKIVRIKFVMHNILQMLKINIASVLLRQSIVCKYFRKLKYNISI